MDKWLDINRGWMIIKWMNKQMNRMNMDGWMCKNNLQFGDILQHHVWKSRVKEQNYEGSQVRGVATGVAALSCHPALTYQTPGGFRPEPMRESQKGYWRSRQSRAACRRFLCLFSSLCVSWSRYIYPQALENRVKHITSVGMHLHFYTRFKEEQQKRKKWISSAS